MTEPDESKVKRLAKTAYESHEKPCDEAGQQLALSSIEYGIRIGILAATHGESAAIDLLLRGEND